MKEEQHKEGIVGKIIFINFLIFLAFSIITGIVLEGDTYWVLGLMYLQMIFAIVQFSFCLLIGVFLYHKGYKQKGKGFLFTGLIIITVGLTFCGSLLVGI